MITAILPATNHKPDWVELQVDGAHTARIWAHAVEVKLEEAVHQFMVTISGANDITEAFVWVDTILQATE